VGRLGPHINRFLRRQDFYSKTLSLHYGTPGQVSATQPCRKSKIVLDAGTHSSLAARRLALDNYGVQTFRSAINGGSQTSGPPTDNRQVVETGLSTRSQPNLLRDVRGNTLEQFCPIW